MPSLTAFGADSTSSLASFRPRPVAPFTALMTAILLPPASARTTSKLVFSSASPAASAAGAAATGCSAGYSPAGSASAG